MFRSLTWKMVTSWGHFVKVHWVVYTFLPFPQVVYASIKFRKINLSRTNSTLMKKIPLILWILNSSFISYSPATSRLTLILLIPKLLPPSHSTQSKTKPRPRNRSQETWGQTPPDMPWTFPRWFAEPRIVGWKKRRILWSPEHKAFKPL